MDGGTILGNPILSCPGLDHGPQLDGPTEHTWSRRLAEDILSSSIALNLSVRERNIYFHEAHRITEF